MSDTKKGHVPEENLERYRRIRTLSRIMDQLGNRVSGMGEHGDANILWAMSARYTNRANELRADVPVKEAET